MKLIELIKQCLKINNYPLTQEEIFNYIENSPEKNQCEEYLRVKVPRSAISRQLSKNSRGSRPIIKKIGRKYSLISDIFYNNTDIKEIDLHPILVKFIKERFNVFCKTINAVKIKERGNKINIWSNPDIVGISFVLLNLNELLQSEVQKQGIISNQVAQFYSFEIKLKIDKFNLTECFFQAVSNSSWANFGYLVVGDMDNDVSFISNLIRLNDCYGIGVIHLNLDDPVKSQIIVPAREKQNIDINFINFLSNINRDFYDFLNNSKNNLLNKKVNIKFYNEF